MKIKFYFSLLAALVVAALVTTASAYDYDFKDGQLCYKITSTNPPTVMVTNEQSVSGSSPRYVLLYDVVDIPEVAVYNGVRYTVTAINTKAIAYCRDFDELRIPATVTSIGAEAFRNCPDVTAIVFKAPSSDAVQIKPLVIGDNAFYMCQALTEITLPAWTSSIGNNVFQGCYALTSFSVDEPSQLTTMGEYTFKSCSKLATINLPSSLTSLGKYSMESLHALKSIRFPDKLTTISDHLCNNCTGLREIIFPQLLTTIEPYAFRNVGWDSQMTEIPAGEELVLELPDRLKTIGAGAFTYMSRLKSITIPSSVETIEGGAIYGPNLESVTFMGKVQSTGRYAFEGDKLKTMIIKSNDFTIAPIPSLATKITTTIYDGVTAIPEGSLQDCTAMEKIVIPASVKSIGNSAFKGCGALGDVVCMLPKPLAIDASVFEGVPVTGYTDLHVPEGSVGRYRAMAVWKDFYGIYEDAGQGGGQLNKFDVNEDGNVDVGDVSAVLDYILEHN